MSPLTPDSSTQAQPIERPSISQDDECGPLVEQLIEEMTECWRQGERPHAEFFLDRFPALWKLPSAILDLVYEEICLRHQHGEPVDRAEMVQRFVPWKQQIEIMLDCMHAMEPGAGLPSAGETFGDFRLLAELGRGGEGCVFVGTQSSLGDRPVVVKITPCRGDEHLSLARLQHTHIVPLLSVLNEPDLNLRVLCMPYFGGLTLSAILHELSDQQPQDRNGRQIMEILDEARSAAAVVLPTGRDPATAFLERASYVQAICWVGACLAEALKYAHDRRLIHLDVKPSNVLWTANHQPMLLDFHLAREPLAAGEHAVRLGGTPVYMAPEQKLAVEAIKGGSGAPQKVDGRSDIFSLGLVLYEALGGPLRPRARGEKLPVRKCNSRVSPGLSDLIAKCLNDNPRDRYQDAGALAADLWAHLNDMPLKGVSNRNMAERWQKWRRRKPHQLQVIGLLALVLIVSGGAIAVALGHLNHRVDDARAALVDGTKLQKKGQYGDAASAFERGLAQLRDWPGNSGLKEQLAKQLNLAARAQLARDLHTIADRCRLFYGADASTPANLKALQAPCQEFWDKRELVLDRLGKELDPETEQQLKLDLLDLAILGANLRVRLAPENNVAAARHEAMQMLDQAEALFGPSAVLFFERRSYAEALGLSDVVRQAEQRAAKFPPRTAWEHYALGRLLLRAGQLSTAAEHFDRAVAIQPNGLWPNFYQGICCYRLGNFDDAALAFTACTAVAPNIAACFYNRALAFVSLERDDRALLDFDRTLALDPGFGDAAFNRGLLHFREKRWSRAADDFEWALNHGANPADTHYQLAVVRWAQHERAGALSHLEQCLRFNPQHAEAIELVKKLQKQS